MKPLSISALLVSVTTAFVATPTATRVGPTSTLLFDAAQSNENPLINMVVDTKNDNDASFLAKVQHAWYQEAEHLRHHERSVWDDPDLDLVVDHDHDAKRANPVFRSIEQHRHDSLGHEMEHAIDSDPYLAHTTATTESASSRKVNPTFRREEAHRHDSLLNEIQHAVQQDPDLKA